MDVAQMLLAAALAVPIAMLLACLAPNVSARMPVLLVLAPVPALAAALFATGGVSLVLPKGLLGGTLLLDVPGAMLLGVAALLWIAAGTYAATYMRGELNGPSFAAWWLTALIGNLGVFIAADVATFYLFFAMGSLAAYGLIAHDGTSHARRAGAVYIGLALLGEALVIMGLVLLAAGPADTLLIRDAVAGLSTSPWRDPTLALLIAGFGLKIGLVPLHVWMPLTYSAAPIPAAAVLSGAAVNAGVIGLVRSMPTDTALPDWGGVLAAAGLLSAFYGVAIGITQSNPKAVLAYSSVSQMGLIATVIGMGLATGDGSATIGAAFYAAHHVLVKGGLFLALGAVTATDARRLWPVLLPAGVVALGLGGLPFTGGALAKEAVKATLGDGAVGLLAALSAAGTTLLMIHFLRRLVASADQCADQPSPAGLVLPWLGVAIASVIVPWLLFQATPAANYAEALSPPAIWSALWPVLLGGALAFGLRGGQRSLPHVPEGDVVVVLEKAAQAVVEQSGKVERVDAALRTWPVASGALVALAIVVAVATARGH
jgi:formate hydrogenlyase subunit 3/multisubunit Na+/H+ antiporter MnhD subunit